MLQNTIITELNLQPHPEGGFFRETYRSSSVTANGPQQASRSLSTGIYFLLTSVNFSALHRIQSDEMWHFYAGDPLEVIEIDGEGNCIHTVIGNRFERGETPQYVVKAGHWFGSRVLGDGIFSLVGCTVSPGFDFADFEMGDRQTLIKEYPKHHAIIEAMTRV